MYSAYSGAVGDLSSAFSVSMIMSLLSSIPSMLFAIATYVITALSLHTIAKRRGIRYAWLAWLPIGNAWILGSLADQYRHLACGQVKSRRKVLLGTCIATEAIAILVLVASIDVLVSLLSNVDQLASMPDSAVEQFMLELLPSMAAMFLLLLPLLVVTVVYAVFFYIALYDVYKSCEPANALLYLVLSILIGICQPIFLLILRKKDDGMVPKFVPVPPQPTWQTPPPQEPWQNQDRQ